VSARGGVVGVCLLLSFDVSLAMVLWGGWDAFGAVQFRVTCRVGMQLHVRLVLLEVAS
jgi:hypothetical protein